jgi:hypothetical protein
MPGAEKQPQPSGRNRLFFQIPNRMLKFCRPPQPHSSMFSTADKVGRTHSKNRCRFRLASVSAFEHPTTTFGQCGLLSTFVESCSLERR